MREVSILPLANRIAIDERPPAMLEDYGGFSFAEPLPGETEDEFNAFETWLAMMLSGERIVATRFARTRNLQPAVVTQNQWLARLQEATRFDRMALASKLTQTQLTYVASMDKAFEAVSKQVETAAGKLMSETVEEDARTVAMYELLRGVSAVKQIAEVVGKVKASLTDRPGTNINVVQATQVNRSGMDAADIISKTLGEPALIGHAPNRTIDEVG